MKRLLRLAPFALLLPTLATASTKWEGTFETGNLSQWDGEQSVSSSRLQVVDSTVREGRYALKTIVRQGDDPINASGNRNELFYLDREPAGSEYYYKWSTLFPHELPALAQVADLHPVAPRGKQWLAAARVLRGG